MTDVLGVRSIITVSPTSQQSSEEDLHEDTSLLSISHVIIKLDTDSPVTTEHQLVSLQSNCPDYAVNCHRPGRRSQDADDAQLHRTHEENSWFPLKDEGGRIDCSHLICETVYVANSCFTGKTAEDDRTNNFSTVCLFSGIDGKISAADMLVPPHVLSITLQKTQLLDG